MARIQLCEVAERLYKQIGRTLAGAVSVVTTRERGTDAIMGLTVSSFVTLSFEPPLVMFAIQHDANSYPAVVSCRSFGVSLLSAKQADIAARHGDGHGGVCLAEGIRALRG